MAVITVGTENSGPIDLHYEDYGSGAPVILIHGYPLSGRAWDKQVPPLLAAGRRVITYDRRAAGKSSQPAFGYDWDTFAADMAALIDGLGLDGVTLVGHSMGTGEVTRYLGNYGSSKVDRAVLIGPIPPYLSQASDNPDGVPANLFDGFRQSATADGPAWLKGFLDLFYNIDQFRGNRVSDEAYNASDLVVNRHGEFSTQEGPRHGGGHRLRTRGRHAPGGEGLRRDRRGGDLRPGPDAEATGGRPGSDPAGGEARRHQRRRPPQGARLGVEILVNNAGVGEGLNVNPFIGIYSASKHAVEAIAETMADELQEYNVEVATVNPGPFLTGFNDRMFQTWESWEDDPSGRLFDYSKLAFPRAQFDPEAVYATLTAVAAGEVDSYRNLEPKSMIEETEHLQQVPWQRKVTDDLGTRHQAIQHSYEMQPETPVAS